jgi:hypothetical protein
MASFPFDGSVCKLDHVISPDGKYLATKAIGYISGLGGAKAVFGLHEIHSQRAVFSEYEIVSGFRFDTDGSLAYLVFDFDQSRDKGKNDHMQLHRWRPDTQQSQMVWEHEVVYTEMAQRTFAYLNNNAVSNVSGLSPDTRTLLFATYQKGKLIGELLDGLTGKVRSTFSISKSHPVGMLTPDVEAIFTSDSKIVVIQTSEINGAILERHWHWIDVQTGKELQRVLIPSELIIEKSLFATATTPVAKATNHHGENVLVSVNNNKVQAIQLDEVKQPLSERGQDKIEPHVIAYELLSQHNLIAYQWTHYRVISQNSLEFLPNYYWSIRELSNGKLIQTSRMKFIDRSEPEQKEDYCSLVTILPGPDLLFMQGFGKKTGVIQEWLNKVRAWLGTDQQQLGLLHLINGTNGEVVKTIHIPQEQTSAVLSPDGKSLMVFSGYDKRIELRTYDFPLHKPWLLILSWALGIAGAITLLVEARRLFPWRKRLS